MEAEQLWMIVGLVSGSMLTLTIWYLVLRHGAARGKQNSLTALRKAGDELAGAIYDWAEYRRFHKRCRDAYVDDSLGIFEKHPENFSLIPDHRKNMVIGYDPDNPATKIAVGSCGIHMLYREQRIKLTRKERARARAAYAAWQELYEPLTDSEAGRIMWDFITYSQHHIRFREAIATVVESDSRKKIRKRPPPALVQGLQDMVKNGRLTEDMIPDDFQWLQAKLKEADVPYAYGELPKKDTDDDRDTT